MGGVGIDAVSSAQSKREGAGIEHGGTELDGGSTGGRGHKTGAGRGSDTPEVANDGGDGETTRLGLIWGKLERMGGEQGVGGGEQNTGGERGAFAGADGVVGDAGGVYHMVDSETARLRGVRGELGGSRSGTGVKEGSLGWQGDVGGVLGLRLGFWGEESGSVE
jgi:hypothetical protein